MYATSESPNCGTEYCLQTNTSSQKWNYTTETIILLNNLCNWALSNVCVLLACAVLSFHKSVCMCVWSSRERGRTVFAVWAMMAQTRGLFRTALCQDSDTTKIDTNTNCTWLQTLCLLNLNCNSTLKSSLCSWSTLNQSFTLSTLSTAASSEQYSCKQLCMTLIFGCGWTEP